MHTRRFVQLGVAFLVPLLALAACSKDRRLPLDVGAVVPTSRPVTNLTSDDDPIVSSVLHEVNTKLQNLHASYRVSKAELLTMGETGHVLRWAKPYLVRPPWRAPQILEP